MLSASGLKRAARGKMEILKEILGQLDYFLKNIGC